MELSNGLSSLSTRTVRTNPSCLSSLFVSVTITRTSLSLCPHYLESFPSTALHSSHLTALCTKALPWTSCSGQQILSILLLQSLPLPSWPKLKPSCHQRALFACSLLLWCWCLLLYPPRLPQSGLERSFLIHLVTHCRFCQAENQRPVRVRSEASMWDQRIAVRGTQI